MTAQKRGALLVHCMRRLRPCLARTNRVTLITTLFPHFIYQNLYIVYVNTAEDVAVNTLVVDFICLLTIIIIIIIISSYYAPA